MILGLPLSIYFQNCAPQGHKGVTRVGDNAVKSPFADKKVVLDSSSFYGKPISANNESDQNSITTDDFSSNSSFDSSTNTFKSEILLKKDIRLVAKINNSCAQSWCAEGQNLDSITCQAFKQGVLPQKKNRFQIYEIKNPGELNETQLQEWAGKSQVDRLCLSGISELRSYVQNALFNDARYSYQQLANDLINFENAQTYFPSSSLARVKVGIIDSGVADDVDLTNVVSRVSNSAWDATPNPLFMGNDQTKPNQYHGTFVAGIVGAIRNNSRGFVGVAPNVDIYAYAIGNGLGQMTNAEIANAIADAVADGLDVVNMSFGNVGGYYNDDPMISDGLIDGYNSNVLFVVAAGNSGNNLDSRPSFPAQYSFSMQNVITVGASDTVGNVASFSNRSATYVNILAPGVSIASVYPSNLTPPAGGVAIMDGTSFAAPMVTGAAALMIGSYRFRNLALDVGTFKKMLTVDGAKIRNDLIPYIKNGAFLDLVLLGQAIQQQSTLQPITISQSRTIDAKGNPQIELSISYNSSILASVSANSRIGVFDLTSGCNYSSSCLIQSLPWPPTNATCVGSNCTYKVILNRDQVITMMSSKTDPQQKLPLSVAIYHVVSGKSIYGVDAASKIDIRDLPGNLGQPIIGEVTNIRMDMQYFYIQGWACLPGSEEAVYVGIIDKNSTSVLTDFAYDYPYMVPHSTIDADGDISWMANVNSSNSFNTGVVHSRAYQASGITVSQTQKNRYPAGLESNPQLVSLCQTLTASHGFELIVPFKQLSSNNLSGQMFKVVAGNTGPVTLSDASGNVQFEFPEIVSSTTEDSFSITRDSQNYQINGSLCSLSPSPIEVEASFTTYNYVWALTNLIPNIKMSDGGFVYDNKLLPTTSKPLPIETVQMVSNTDMTLKFTKDTLVATDSDPFTKAYKSFSSYPPNAGIGGPTVGGGISDASIQNFAANINSYNKFLRIGTGENITYYRRNSNYMSGPAWDTLQTLYQNDRSNLKPLNPGTSVANYKFWDFYDVGQPFSTNLVAYDFSGHYENVASYLSSAYQISSALREAKKFETPLAKGTGLLGHGNLSVNWSGSCSSGIKHELSNYVISDYIKYAPFYTTGASGFWIQGGTPNNYVGTTTALAMRNLPITLRFFQDGKLVLHLESDSGSNFRQVDYSFK
ncbi:MAG: S8 family serine peptidase [Deltaproteobacteria bacterium]|nr:S8 family serine peptidase [Deltaproteobacteria bacterium]